MKKLTYPKAVRQAWINDRSLPISVDAPLAEVIGITAKILGKKVPRRGGDDSRSAAQSTVDRRSAPRRRFAADDRRWRYFRGHLLPALSESMIDLYAGIGGAPEGVLAAAALCCLGGGMQAKIWPRDEAERKSLVEAGWGDRLNTTFRSLDLARQGNPVHRHRHLRESASQGCGSARSYRDHPFDFNARQKRHRALFDHRAQSGVKNDPFAFGRRRARSLMSTPAPVLEAIRRLLEEHGVAFQEKRHPPTLTSEESAAARGRATGSGGEGAAAENRRNDFDCSCCVPIESSIPGR